MTESIGVVGLGMVGGTIAEAFTQAEVTVRGYDRYLQIGRPEDLAQCQVIFVCVSTPSSAGQGYDLTELWSAVEEFEPFVTAGTIVAVKSTVAPGTNDRLAEAFPGLEFASVPEFLVAARPLQTFTHPDRVIVGARSSVTATRLTELMRLVAPEAPVLVVDPNEAELSKLCANVLLGAKVAVANELHDVCDRYDISWSRIQAIVGLDRRIGPDHLSVTRERGFGGACLPKDLDGLISAAESRGHDPSLLREISAFNRRIRESTQTEHELTQTKRVVRSESEPLTSSNGHREVGASPRLATGGRPRRVS